MVIPSFLGGGTYGIHNDGDGASPGGCGNRSDGGSLLQVFIFSHTFCTTNYKKYTQIIFSLETLFFLYRSNISSTKNSDKGMISNIHKI